MSENMCSRNALKKLLIILTKPNGPASRKQYRGNQGHLASRKSTLEVILLYNN